MKDILRVLVLIVICLIGFAVTAQNVSINGKTYQVKETLIFEGETDITEILTAEEKEKIFAAIDAKKNDLVAVKTEAEKSEALEKAKEQSKAAEEEKKKAEKAYKKAEKVKQKEAKAKAKYAKMVEQHQNASKRYEKLKAKGKLSPIDEGKWLKKIEKMKAKMAKTKSKI